MIAAELVERFWRSVSPEPNTGCWLWSAGCTGTGYGALTFKGKFIQAHRLAWEILRTPIPVVGSYHGICVLHRCDTPPCVNPDHLFLGTVADNNSDRSAKGRSSNLSGPGHPNFGREGRGGETNPASKLTLGSVREIKARLASGEKQDDIAAAYGVKQPTISNIKTGATWLGA